MDNPQGNTAAKPGVKKKNKLLSTTHVLIGCRFDVWLRLLIHNRFRISPDRIPQAILMTLFSLILWPFALLEALLLALPLSRVTPRRPVFILGFWRSGTTFLVNTMSRDPAYGFFDPLDTITFSNCWLLRPLFRLLQGDALANARPMDNLKYAPDLPMEEIYALSGICPYAVTDLLIFPNKGEEYLNLGYVEELPARQQAAWDRAYRYIIRKITWLKHGKLLIMKSPDNTMHGRELLKLYPDGRFVNIHRDPYAVIRSTINMFQLVFEQMRLQAPLDEEYLEDMIVYAFARTYRKLFQERQQFPDAQWFDVAYEEFERQPLPILEQMYAHLGLGDFQQAKPHLERFLAAQKGFVKNKFDYPQRLVEKVDRECGFYFDHYGYQRMADREA